MLTLDELNAAIQEEWPHGELLKIGDYFYLWSNDDEFSLVVRALPTNCIQITDINHLTIPEWLNAVQRLFKAQDKEISSPNKHNDGKNQAEASL